MQLTQISGFFSYAHGDDSCGRLSMLRNDLITEYRQITGDDLELFIDREGINWGDMWSSNIETGIDNSYFFIPVLSPQYFRSFNCQKELKQFLDKAKREKAEELILPIYYIDIAYADLNPEDKTLKEVFEYQYVDWRDIRFAEQCSERYRSAVGHLAQRLAEANRDIEKKVSEELGRSNDRESEREIDLTSPSVCDKSVLSSADDDNSSNLESTDKESFLIDSVAEVDRLSHLLSPQINTMTQKMGEIGQVVQKYTKQMEAAGPTPKASIALLAQLANDLNPIADDYLDEAEKCANIMADLDQEVRSSSTAWKRIQRSLHSQATQVKEKDGWQTSINSIVAAAEGVRPYVREFNEQVGVLKGVSRVLSKPLRKIEMANTLIEGILDTAVSWAD